MKNLRRLEANVARNLNGGSPYCTVCGWADKSEWKVMGHIAGNHPASVLKTMWSLGMSAAKAAARLLHG